MSIIEFYFYFISFAAIPLWLALIFIPRNKILRILIDIYIVFACFIFFLNTFSGTSEPVRTILSPTIYSLIDLFSTPKAMVGGWIHFTLSDLWFGRWISGKCLKYEIPHFARVLCLMMAFVFGPVGILMYYIFKVLKTKKLSLR